MDNGSNRLHKAIKRAASLLSTAALLLGSSYSYGYDIEVHPVVSSGQGTAGYDPLEDNVHIQPIDIKVKRTHHSETSHYFLTFSKTDQGNYDRQMEKNDHVLDYQIYTDVNQQNILKELEDTTTSSSVLVGKLTGNTTEQNLRLYLVIPAHQMIMTGDYSDTLTIRLYRGKYGSGSVTEVFQQQVEFHTHVNNLMGMKTVEQGGNIDSEMLTGMHFNAPEEGTEGTWALVVQTNEPFSVMVGSEHHGMLKRNEHPDGEYTNLHYTLMVDDTEISLADGMAMMDEQGEAPTAMEGKVYTTKIIFHDTSRKFGGEYSDTITFVCQSRE